MKYHILYYYKHFIGGVFIITVILMIIKKLRVEALDH